MIIFFIFWSCFYCTIFKIIIPLIKNENINGIVIAATLVSGYHLWFVYLIIGLYLIVPLLRLWVNKNNKKYIEYFIVLSMIFTYTLPQIIGIAVNFSGLFWGLNTILDDYLSLKYIGGFTTYFILGWYLNNYDIKNKKNVYILGLISLATTIFGTYMLSYSTGKILSMYDNLYLNILFQSIAIFVLIKYKFKDKQNNIVISSISKYSLGIYAIHVLIIKIIFKFLEMKNMHFALINIPLVFIVTFALSYLISFVFSKIPFLKRVV